MVVSYINKDGEVVSYYDKERENIKSIITPISSEYYSYIDYYETINTLKSIIYYKKGIPHSPNDNIVACTYYHNNGNKKLEIHYFEGKYHNLKYPAITEYNKEENIIGQYWFRFGERHRGDNLPAVIRYSTNKNIKNYYENGKFIRTEITHN